MKNQILNLGKALNKDEQRSINGGFGMRNGQCLVPDPANNNQPVLVGYAPCDGVSLCPAQTGFNNNTPYRPMCFSF